MNTLLKMKTGAPGESSYQMQSVAATYNRGELNPAFVEKVSLERSYDASPAETPATHGPEGRDTYMHQYPVGALNEEEDEEDELDDVDLDLDDDDEEEEVTELDDDDLDLEDDDLDLDLDDDDEEEEEII